MPHLLIAGTTGSGKSMALNGMLLGLLSQRSSDDMKLILIDPKQLEFSCFDSLAHLLTPVITEMGDAAEVLSWCVEEMESRYQAMSEHGARHIDDYNKQTDSPLPRIVIVADEFADMMMSVGSEVETLLVRLAQKARAAGMHLILATQRPSTKIVSGGLKSSISARLSFAVSSYYDSRTIIDQSGAEKLLGSGDMLFLPPGHSTPTRIQAPLVCDEDFDRLLSDTPPISCLPPSIGPTPSLRASGPVDALYGPALEFVVAKGEASISKIQREFSVGYNRAARIIEQMEEEGVVGPQIGNGSRDVIGFMAAG